MEGRSDCIMSLRTWQKLTAASTRNMVCSAAARLSTPSFVRICVPILCLSDLSYYVSGLADVLGTEKRHDVKIWSGNYRIRTRERPTRNNVRQKREKGNADNSRDSYGTG